MLTGLTNGTGYDVQVRAVADTDGAWSATATGTPAEHGDTLETATTLPLATRMGGMIAPGTDVDYFKIELAVATGIIIFTRGDLDTVGQLLGSDGVLLSENDQGDGAARAPQLPPLGLPPGGDLLRQGHGRRRRHGRLHPGHDDRRRLHGAVRCPGCRGRRLRQGDHRYGEDRQ